MTLSRSSSPADPLSDLVRLLHPQPAAFKRLSGAERWAVKFPGSATLNFGTVARGHCVASGVFGSLDLEVGDFLLLSSTTPFGFGSDDETVAACTTVTTAEHESGALHFGVGPEHTHLLVWHYELATANAELLMHLLPEVCHIRARDHDAPAVHRLVDLLGAEIGAHRPGSGLVAERLADLVLIEVLRRSPVAQPTTSNGLIEGLADPVVAAALKAVHRDVAHPWTVAQLARVANVSRSALAARFTRATGTTPMAYLLTWRMALAKDMIARGDRSHSRIAQVIGYSSGSSFSTAFKRHVGRSPAGFAADLRSGSRLGANRAAGQGANHAITRER